MTACRTGPRRWPLHPHPGPYEALSSWLERLAACYQLSSQDLLRHNLGPAAAPLAKLRPEQLDEDPPTALLEALATRTGVDTQRLRDMTLAGWVPWLLDTLQPAHTDEAQAIFDTYIRQTSVLLRPGEAGANELRRWPSWRGPWLPAQPMRRTCPTCATDPERGTALVWRLPLVHSCLDHGCQLDDTSTVTVATLLDGPLSPTPVSAPLAALDRHTYQGLTTGQVTLPARTVHVGAWFRLLRSLLDELTVCLSRLGRGSAATMRHIWQHTGHPVRAGLTVWKPYELLDQPRQAAILEAAAVTIQLAEYGTIPVRGTLGALLVPETHASVYNGDPPIRVAATEPSPSNDPWQQTQQALRAVVDDACTNPTTARQLLSMLTYPSHTVTDFDRVRHTMREAGIPAEYLPNHHQLGRTDLA